MSLDWKVASACDSGHCVAVAWHKASASADSGDCVEVGWRSASTSDASCVEAGEGACGLVHVRDSKLGDASPVLDFDPEQWANLLVETATFGLPTRAAVLDTGAVVLTDPSRPLALVFTPAEWDAFEAGVIAHEFDLKEAAT